MSLTHKGHDSNATSMQFSSHEVVRSNNNNWKMKGCELVLDDERV